MTDLDGQLVAKARTNIGYFARLVGRPLSLQQAESVAFNTPHRFHVILAPRQGGKSEALALRAVHWAFSRPASVVLMISASDESAKHSLAKARAIVQDAPMLAEDLTDDFTALLRFSNGSEIRSVPASERQIRGRSVDLLIIDEAALVERDVFIAAFGTVAARSAHARIIVASTANRADGMFYDLYQQAGVREDIAVHHWTTDDCPWITPSFLDSQRAVMSPTRYAAEYEGTFASGADALFTRQMVEAVVRDFAPWDIQTLPGPARLSAGVDWGATNDRSAFVAIGRLPEAGPRIFGVVCAHRWPAAADLEEQVITDIVTSPAHIARLTVETNGLGYMPTRILFRRFRERDDARGGSIEPTHRLVRPMELDRVWRRANRPAEAFDPALMPKPLPGVVQPVPFETRLRGIHTSAQMKASAYAAVRMLIARRALLIPRDAEDLIRELLMLRVQLAQGGSEKVEAATGHDDLADALAFATGPYQREGDTQWRSWIADLADPATAVPEAAYAVKAVDRLPHLPVVQSVAGTQLTTPPHWQPANAPAPTLIEQAVHASHEARSKEHRRVTER